MITVLIFNWCSHTVGPSGIPMSAFTALLGFAVEPCPAPRG